MQRREFIAGLSVAAAAAQSANRTARPNILWISCEDTSPDLGCYGDRYARTPNLDRLASEGARYTNAFSVYGVCAPSRSSIITGMYPATIGSQHMRSQAVPPSYVRCFTEYLRAAGYYCSNNVKTDYNFDSPVTAWDESSNRAHWRNRAADQPFFAVFNIVTTHESRIRFPAAEFRKVTEGLAASDRHDPAKAELPPYYPDTPVVRRDWANYYDLVSVMDGQVASYLKELDDAGLRENTIVVFFGDHGRGLPRAKRWVYDSGIRVPLLVRWPGRIQPGSINTQMVSLMDLGPSMLEACGIAPPAHMQGQPFLGDRAPRRYIYAARDRMDETYDIIRAVRDHRYKYIRNYQHCKPYAQHIEYMDQMPTLREWRRLHAEGKLTGAQSNFFAPEKPVEELYDTPNDPHEVVNLASDPKHKTALARLRRAHQAFMTSTRDQALVPEAALKERMRPGGVWAVTQTPVITKNGEIACATKGASIAYTFEPGEQPRWKLYSRPIVMESGRTLRKVGSNCERT